MLKIKRTSLLANTEYEDYDDNVVKLTAQEEIEFEVVRKSCCGSTSGCSKTSGKGSCCGSKGGCRS